MPSHAQVNVIEHWDTATLERVQQNFGDNAWVIVVGSPNNDGFAEAINNYSFNWVIRGHAHWLTDIGQQMFTAPEAAAAQWNSFFTKLNKEVYFQPWAEPSSIDPECNKQPLESCIPRIVRFINALDTSKIKLTTPAFDPHNQENPASRVVELMKENGINFNIFDAAVFHVYSPNLAQQLPQLLSQWGVPSIPIIVAESGILVNGQLTYEAEPLCEDMYCNGVVDYWDSNSQIIGWAMFSNYQGWNIWEHQCVIDALKGNCHCETCEDSDESKNIKELAKELYNRSSGKSPNLDNAKVGRNWPGGATTTETNKSLWQILLTLIQRIATPVSALFRPVEGRGPIAQFIENLLGSQDLVPSDRNGRYPGEDYYVERILSTNPPKLELPGTTAQICLPSRDINYELKYFPTEHPEEFIVELLNLTSVHEQVSNSLQVYAKMRDWVTGSAYSDYLEYIDMSTKEGEKRMAKRSLTDLFRAGYLSKRLPAEELPIEGNNFANKLFKRLLASGDPNDDSSPQANNEDIESGIPVADKPVLRICEDGLLTEEDYQQLAEDGRVRRDLTEGCEGAREIKISELCCNRDHIESLGLDYNKVCEDVPGWACEGDHPKDSSVLYGSKYTLGKFASDSGISEADWPIYLEQCFVVKEEECEDKPSYNGLFVDLSDNQRANIFPPSTRENPHPQNSYLTRAKGECLSCQIVKLFLPEGLGALDACRHMASTYLPKSMYEDMIDNDFPEKKEFSCDVGELPYTDGNESNKDNADYRNFRRTWNEERWHGFVTQMTVDNSDRDEVDYEDVTIVTGTDPNTGEDITETISVPERWKTNIKVKSYMYLYVPHYEKLQLCTNLFYGLLPGADAEDLEKELEELNGNKLQAKDLLEGTRVNDAGSISSGLDLTNDGDLNDDNEQITWGSNLVHDWLNNRNKIWGRSTIEQDKEIYLPGGGTDAFVNASGPMYIPKSLQEAGWFSGAAASSSLPASYSPPGNWATTPSEMMNIPSHFRSEIMNLQDEVIAIAQEVGVPPEVPFVLWLKEAGGRRENPSNGEGLCGFHSLVNQGAEFPPGPINEGELLRQLELCAEQYKARASGISFNTTDPSIIGTGYANYNGNVDCMGEPYPTWQDHPYVMNGYDSGHMNMVARLSDDYGPNNCVVLSVIGAWPAHLRIRDLMSTNTSL